MATRVKAAAHAQSPLGINLLTWPGTMYLFLAGVALIYAPIIAGAADQWLHNDNYAHGLFIFPVSIFLLWMQKDKIASAERRPQVWGLLPLLVGLAGAVGGYLLQIKYIGMWSLIPTLIGGILLLHGPRLYKIVHFPVWFLLFAAPIPNSFLGPLTGQIQGYSCTGAAIIMTTLGFPVIQHANVLQVPGASLEVATACSGFHKLISLLAFAAIYGHLFLDTPVKRTLLVLLAGPIALLVNVLRICSLVAATIYAGLPGLHATHDPAEYAAIGVSFVLFIFAGKKLGSKTALDFPSSAASSPVASLQPIIRRSLPLAAACFVLVFGVVAVEYIGGPVSVAHPRKLPVEGFPARLGAWQGGAVAQTDPEIQARLRTSAIMDRQYATGDGRAADVMLVTASDNLDIHDPKDCFPSQGWQLTNFRSKTIQGQGVSLMDAELDGQKMTVLYWTMGVYTPPAPRYAAAQAALALRNKIVPRHEAVSLFVRLMVPQGPHADETVTQLAGEVLPPVQAMLQAKKKPGEQISALPAPPTRLAAGPNDRTPNFDQKRI